MHHHLFLTSQLDGVELSPLLPDPLPPTENNSSYLVEDLVGPRDDLEIFVPSIILCVSKLVQLVHTSATQTNRKAICARTFCAVTICSLDINASQMNRKSYM
jgi:hypothetical protein